MKSPKTAIEAVKFPATFCSSRKDRTISPFGQRHLVLGWDGMYKWLLTVPLPNGNFLMFFLEWLGDLNYLQVLG